MKTEANWRRWTLITLAYSTIALFMTYPLLVQLTDRLAGDHGDVLIFVWNRWWVRQALTRGMNLYFTPYMFFPRGGSLLFHSIDWVSLFTCLALEPSIGDTGAYNLTILANFVLCALAMFALIRYLGGREEAAFVGGLVYAFYPYHVSNLLNCPILVGVQWLPLYVLFLLRATREGRYTSGVLAGLFLAMTALSGWHLLVMAGLITFLWIAYSTWREPSTRTWRSLSNLAVMGLSAVLLMAPFLFPILRYFAEGGRLEGILTHQEHIYQTDLLAYLVPSRLHPFFGPLLDRFYDVHFIHNRKWQAFPGYTVLALFGYAFYRRHSRSAFWALLAVVTWALALGPYLRVAGRLVWEIPLPYHLVAKLPFIRTLRAPDRLNTILGLPLSVLAALSISDLLRQVEQRWGKKTRRWMGTLLGCLVLFEFLVVPFPTMQPRISPFYERLGSGSETYAVADIPTGWRASRYYMYYQTVHHHPITEGHISRPIPGTYHFIEQVPILSRAKQDAEEWELTLPDISRQLAFLADAGVRYVIVHKDIASGQQLAAWLDWITLRPRYEDEQLLVYSTRPEYGRDFQWQYDLGTDIGIIQANVQTDAPSQGGILEIEVRWGSRAAPGRDLAAQFSLVNEAGVIQQTLEGPLCADWPTSDWPAGAVAIGRYSLQIDPHTPPGRYALSIRLDEIGNSVPLTYLDIAPLPRLFEPPARMEHPLDVHFGGMLRLLGYDLDIEQGSVRIVLHWQALRRMDVAYKFFIHLYDEQETLIAQADIMPRDWTYPTTWWETGEVVSDRINLSAPPGRYCLAVGVYHPQTGERLPLQEKGTLSESNDALLLQEVIIP